MANETTLLGDPQIADAGTAQEILEPTTQEISGVGTLETIPKTPLASVASSGPATEGDTTGLLESTGTATPPPLVDNPNLNYTKRPSLEFEGEFDVYDSNGKLIDQKEFQDKKLNIDHIKEEANQSTTQLIGNQQKALDDLEKSIVDLSLPTEKEKELIDALQAQKEIIRQFELDTEATIEGFTGQGRGRTTALVANQQTKERRTRALEKLGLSNELLALSEQLGIETEQRKTTLDLAKDKFGIAEKRFDLAVGLREEMKGLKEEEANKARAFILDVLDLAEGKTFEELDPETQRRIMEAVSKTQLTLDMVKTALKSGVEEVSGGGTTEGVEDSALSKDEFRKVAEEEALQSLRPDVLDNLYEEYLKQFNETSEGGKSSGRSV